MEKKSGYRYRIEQELLQKNWELLEIDSKGEWWDDKHWEMQFKFQPEISFFLCFIVDPSFEGTRKKGQGVYEIKASTRFPESWNDTSSEIASLFLYKREFDIKLNEFLNSLETFKKARIAEINKVKTN